MIRGLVGRLAWRCVPILVVPVVLAVGWVAVHVVVPLAVPGLIVLVAAVAARLTLAVVRFVRLPGAARRYWLLARWYRLGWRRLARNLDLAVPDKHRGGIDSPLARKVNCPRARFRPDSHGWMADVKLIPGVTREVVEQQAVSLADQWGAVRVGVTQHKPGRVRVRAMRTDPLTEPLAPDVLPPRWDGRHLVLGRDEWGQVRRADLANLSGSAFSGSPGRGKTGAALSLAVQLAPSPLVDMWILDGGACDWAEFADGAAGYVGDDLGAAVDMLQVLDASMCDRRRNLQAVRGTRNGWSLGPAEDYRLQWILAEEAPFFLDVEAVKGDRRREELVRQCRGLFGGLLRRGRAPLFHTTLIAQKGTGSGGLPPDLRDLCGLRWSFGVATTDAAVAILGDDVRKYETVSPVRLQGPEHVGVASVLLPAGQSPYALVRFPAIGQDLADQAAVAMAARRAAPVLEDALELVDVSGPGR